MSAELNDLVDIKPELTWEQIAVIVDALEYRKKTIVFAINSAQATEIERNDYRRRLAIINDLLVKVP
jgi:hypothetical protein